MSFAGLDPGQTGACVVVDDDGLTVRAVQQWKKCKVPPAITILGGVSVIAVEAQHVAGPHASLVLSEWCGRLLATLPPELVVTRPLATSWRAKVFRSGRMQREPAKRLAIAAARPHLLAFGIVEPSHDLAEAWCLARYAVFWSAAHPLEAA